MKMPPLYASDLMKDCTFTVEVEIRETWRVHLGLWLMRLAARVIGCRIEVRNARP